MAEDNDKSQKTEQPTSKRLQDALERGEVVKSQDVVSWAMLAAATALFGLFAGSAAIPFTQDMSAFLAKPHAMPVDGGGLMLLARQTFFALALPVGLPLLILFMVAIGANMIQHPPVLSADKLKWDLSKLSPMKGLARMLGREGFINLLKGAIKIAIVGTVAFFVLWPRRVEFEALITLDLAALLPHTMDIAVEMLVAILAVLAVFAALDYFYQRFAFIERLKMSRQEVKEEFKQTEGDPHVRAKIRQVRLDRSRKRMMAAVPKATAVITNPTHYAVALRYESGKMRAPVCVAKGVDALALRIREVAKEHDVPLIENPPLARALYGSVEVDAEVQPEHYKAVAQVIGFVMRLKGKARQPARR
jgi:flagellar biosynthesis protein FlhB